ncbi:tRNA uridine 5-carboxymethylaminomethyl modification enzyme MnmG [Rhynchospora pubera]|uniref:tRNA uridine 5-carboxymethylaminomethyl modification enzyme MnmG n=1 Tax=Rhynchospora pubera TaxID=906938 RepID=A0AAV8F3M9_9POAL|nr:tRNA uridine 5-carboxymethylaminomethyl modification enzyme MnmG [Rhynchospora pubera]
MRKRDLGILLLAALAIFFSLQHEGDFTFREAWVHFSEDYPVKYEAERLPPPLVTDLNGDGKAEILVATHDAKIQVLEPHGRRIDEGFTEARVLADVSLLPDKVRITSGRRAVAMAAGVVDRSFMHGEVKKKKVLVVVTSGWSVMCFDHNLKKLWEQNLQEDFPHGAHHREISISISNYTLKHGDAGLIIVGGRMEMQHHNNMDVLEEMMMSGEDDHLHRRSASEKEQGSGVNTVDLRHFAFYAFAGRTGQIRWSRKNENIDAQPSDASIVLPQHNYKLDAHALNSRRPGEFECRDFRESVLRVMPHHWDRREDTSFQLAHFKKHKRKTTKKIPGRSTATTVHKPSEDNPLGKNPSNKIAKAIGKAADYAASSRPKKRSLYIPTITNHTQVWWVPNVVVAHQKEGIEVLHLASGRTICKLHLTEGLHADINGDGVLDHVQVVGRNGAEMSVVSGTAEVLRPCWAVATSGVPVREKLFNVSICHYYSHLNFFPHGDFSRSFHRNSYDTSNIEAATPILVSRDDGHRHMKGSHGDVIFLTSNGEVTSYSPGLHGHDAIWRWQLSTGATWSNLPSPAGLTESVVVPTLKSFSLRAHDPREVIIAAGDQEAVVLSPNGGVLTEVELPGPPTHAIILQDFSNDGLTDLIVVTAGGVYGFTQTRQPGALFFSTLVGCLIVVMAVLFVSQQINSSNKKSRSGQLDYR